MQATETIQRIDSAIEKDQGARYRQALGRIIPKMEDAYRGASESRFRKHLGASLIGRECSFELWLSFRWAKAKKFPGKILRLFNRGHLEEARFLAMLEAAGFEVWYETEDGGQFKFSDHGGHFGSALDAVIKGLPEVPEGVPTLGEFKTHNEKSFAKLAGPKPQWGDERTGGEGLHSAKHEHYVQMQVCMRAYGLEYGLYLAVNKDTDELYGEILKLDITTADRYTARAQGIIFSDEAPPRISETPGWWKCRFCDVADICHKGAFPEENCRTCVHITACDDGTWDCSYHPDPWDLVNPEEGCGDYLLNPHMTPDDKEGQAEWRTK